MRDDGRRPRRPVRPESKVKMGGAKTTKKTQQNNNNRKGMPVEEWRKDGVAPFNTPPQLEGASNKDRKLPEKKNEVTSRKPPLSFRRYRNVARAKTDVTTKNVRHKKRRDTEPATAGGLWHPM